LSPTGQLHCRRTTAHPCRASQQKECGSIKELVFEPQEEWQLERSVFFLEATMARMPEPEEVIVLSDAAPAGQAAPATC
jgi:hypothetical protein